MIEFTLGVRAVNPTNNRQHWRPVWRRAKMQRALAKNCALECVRLARMALPAVVTMTRISPGTLDDDNLRPALKPIRDGIADAFGVADNDPRIEWRYAQERGKPKVYAVRIMLETKGNQS